MAVQQLTLNQTVKLIREIAQSHNQINTIYFGDVWEFLAQPDNVYPAMFYSLTGSQISGKNLAMDFSLFFLDRQLQDESNETDVLSDQLLIGQDIFAMMRYPKFDWKLEEDVSIEFFTENEKDFLAGVKLDITINYPMMTDRCQVPSSFSYPDFLQSLSPSGSVNYVRFLIDVATYSALPTLGDAGKIYVTNDTNKLYRWVDNAWVMIYPGVSWGDISGSLANQTDLKNALDAKAPLSSPTFTGTVSGITKLMVGLGNVDNTSDASKPISSATQTALNAKYDASNPLGFISGITSSNVTTALGYTPYNATNPSGYISGITSGNVTTALGYIPYNSSNPSNFIAKTDLSAGAGISYNSTTGVISSSITQYTDSNARAAITLTTNGTSGAATYNATTGVLNIPSYTGGGGGGSGTVTSVDMTVPLGLSVSGNPITTSGTLALSFVTGYSIPTTANQTNWTTAYGWGNHASAGYLTGITSTQVTTALGFTPYNATNPNGYTSNVGTVTSVAALTLGTSGTDVSSSVATGTTTPVITLNLPTSSATNRGLLSSADWSTFNGKQSAITLTTSGSSGASTFSAGTLNIPTYTLAGLGGQASSTNLTSLSGLTYASASFVKMTAAGTFSLDTNTYYLASNPSGYTNNTGTVTSVGGTGTVNGLTLTGTVTSTGNLTLGGTLDLSAPPAIGGTTANTGRFTTITSTVATGTAPFTVTSTTNVPNLNASSLNGATFASPGTIGGTTAGAGNFTSLSVTTGYYDIQPAPTALTATGTLTIAQIQGDIITVTSSSAVSLTLPTGTLTDAGVLGGALQTNGCFDWFIINLGSTLGAVTMVAGTAHTYVGNATVAINTSAQFRTRKTAANTFVTYRIG